MKNSACCCRVVCAISAIGALNWGLVGLLDLNLVNWLFSQTLGLPALVEKVVYILVGVSGAFVLFKTFFKK